ncbi:MAG: peptide-methionine (S)-S-oxide reductase MsrA [Sedimentisphaerales bacterium]|nr:peptide-methionine (S)-S-oxide reductase MsrA [Sedimentisphaerales bacterium]
MKFKSEILIFLAAIAALVLLRQQNIGFKGSEKMSNAPPRTKPADPNRYEKAIFAAGCFWHVQYEFDHIPGVISTTVGYTGGTTENPTYKQVCTGKTGHAEAIEIIYDPNRVSYEKLLNAFFENHDPTTLNRQGPDVGLQYRSAIFYYNDSQRQTALAAIKNLSKSNKYPNPVVTEVKPAGPFYQAEEYHQKYLEKTGVSSCKTR